jgi:uncharacterized protein (UPF0261 family)
MVSLDELATLRPEGIDFESGGHTVTIMPTTKTRRLGLGVPDVTMDWQVLSDGNTVGYIEKGQDVILAWKPTQLDDGLPAELTSIDEAVEFLAGDAKKPQHNHNKHPHTKH